MCIGVRLPERVACDSNSLSWSCQYLGKPVAHKDDYFYGTYKRALWLCAALVSASLKAGYQRMVARAGEAARFSYLVHSHMLRHSCGYKLANDGQDTRAIQHYLGHRSSASTVRYTALAPDRFKGFWKD